MTHPELKATFQLEILGVKKNPNGQAYTGLGVVTKGERCCSCWPACACVLRAVGRGPMPAECGYLGTKSKGFGEGRGAGSAASATPR